ncbi:MAG: TetR/AcrR family transcriptional regulator [Actinomycetota bacterium]|nr:TetR/AcrR family transcriptional regulator [Actinomycetota bacterium]
MAPSTPKASDAAASTRLSADDWIRAAFEIMVDEGIGGVKIQRLCERLGVTKGSFYWHFVDIDAFHGALAKRWAEEAAHLPGDLEPDADAEAVMLGAMGILSDRRNRNLIRAMRNWAHDDDRARAAIREADRLLFGQVKAAFVALGFDDDDADVRAKVLYYAGVGFVHVGALGRRPSPGDQLAATWEILTKR